MRAIFYFLFVLFLQFSIVSCNTSVKSNKLISGTIDVFRYEFINSHNTTISDTSIVQLLCKTNFPNGTIIIVNANESIDQSSTEIPSVTDTITIHDSIFTFQFPKSFLMTYCIFSILREQQTDAVVKELERSFVIDQFDKCPNCIYFSCFRVDYKTISIAGKGSLPVPVEPNELEIEKITK
jgi:hypothetical protein